MNRSLFFLIQSLAFLGFLAQAQAAPDKAPKPKYESLRFSVVGDIMTHSSQIRSAYNKKCRCYDFRPVFRQIKPYLVNADFTIGNLETTLPGPKVGYTKRINFGAPDSLASALKWAGFDVLVTANNHICDKGIAGLKRTLDVLDKNGFIHIGATRTKKAFRKKRFVVLKKRGWRVALLSYSSHMNQAHLPKGRVNMLYTSQMRRDIRLARKQKFDAIIVHIHQGYEYRLQPHDIQLRFFRKALRYGADIVLGGHPHVVQPFYLKMFKDRFGVRKQRFIAYSLGNFVSGMYRRHTDGGIILNFSLRKYKGPKKTEVRVVDIDYEPFWVNRWRLNKKRIYEILPIRAYIKDGRIKQLKKHARYLMMRYYRDITKHLRPSMRAVRRAQKRFEKRFQKRLAQKGEKAS